MAAGRRRDDRVETVNTIKHAAALYKAHLVGKTFLYVFDNRYIEVIFKAENFKHLAGVDSPLSAKRFYSLAVNRQLESNQISFSSRHPFALCRKKLAHISELAHLAESESFMLEEIVTNSRTYKFGTTDLNFTLCMGEDLYPDGEKKSGCYVVQSLRDEDCFDKARNVYSVTHILSKSNDTKLYSNIIYVDHASAQLNLPTSVTPMMTQDILKKLNVAANDTRVR